MADRGGPCLNFKQLKKLTFLFFVYLVLFLPAHAQVRSYLVTEYGAKPDNSLNTASIQRAIDAAFAAGGGEVIIPEGVFVTGTIILWSGVTLQLDKGAVLQGSERRKDYGSTDHLALIYARGQEGITISGKGTIDGRGRELMKDIFKGLREGTLTDPDWKRSRPRESSRVSLFYFEECGSISVSGVLLKDASTWVTHYERCRDITIDNIHLESVAYWNNDGIDIVDCKNVRITNSYINSADDGICLKSGRRDLYCDSVYIENCTIRSSASAFKLGTGSTGGFRNITVRKLKVFDTFRSAIALESVDGGLLENIDIRGVKATNTGNALFIRLGHRNKDEQYAVVRNIYIADVEVEVPAGKPDKGYETEAPVLRYPPGSKPDPDRIISVSPWNYSYPDPEAVVYKHNVFPSSVAGLPDHPVENVTIENVTIRYAGTGDSTINYMPLDSVNIITEATGSYPEFSMFGELPAWGFYIRHVNGLTLRNIRLIHRQTDYRAGVVIHQSENVELKNIRLSVPSAAPAVFINKSKNISVRKLKLPRGKKNGAVLRNAE